MNRVLAAPVTLALFFLASQPAAAAVDGIYEGTTDQGYPITITVSGGEITKYTFGWHCMHIFSDATTVREDCEISEDGSFRCGSAFCGVVPYQAEIEIRGDFWGNWVFGELELYYQSYFPPDSWCCRLLTTFEANLSPTLPEFSIGDERILEGDVDTKLAQFDVSLNFWPTGTATVDWTTADDTADSSDYAPSSGTLTFENGQMSKSLSVVVYGDTEEESDEVFKVYLSNPTNATIRDALGRCTILDDDSPVFEILHDQTNYASTWAAPTQDYELSKDAEDCEAADDFEVPDGGWQIEKVELRSVYSHGSGPAEGMNIWFYRDEEAWPGTSVACSYSEIMPASDEAGNGTFGMVVVDLPSPCILSPGRYWLAAQARMDYAVGGEFFWSQRTRQSWARGVWRQPGDGWGWGFTSWTRLLDVKPESAAPDLNFRLLGKTEVPPIFIDDFESGDCSAWSDEVP